MKKAQIQMGENVIILFIFFILLVFAVIFFTKIQSAKVEQKVSEDVEGRGLQIAQRVSFLPELQCTKDNAPILGCYDEYNIAALDVLARRGENRDYYFDTFGYSVVSVYRVFPQVDSPLLIYSNPKDNFTSVLTTNTPITLCNFIDDTEKGDCSFAVLKIEVYN